METKSKLREASEDEERAFYGGKAGAEWLDAVKPLGTDASKPYFETKPRLIAIFAQRQGGVRAGIHRQNCYLTESVGIATASLSQRFTMRDWVRSSHTPTPINFLNALCGRSDSERQCLLLVTGYPAPVTTPTSPARRYEMDA